MALRVVDASALGALLFGEPEAEEVADRLGRNPLVAPSLLNYEVGSVCLKKIRKYPDRRKELLDSLALLPQMEIRVVQVPIVEAVPMAEQADLTLYDASYLWLARSLEAKLVTLDRDLEQAAGPRARS